MFLFSALLKLGLKQYNDTFFDTLKIKVTNAEKVKVLAEENHVNFLHINKKTIGISINETTTLADIEQIIDILAHAENLYSFKIADHSPSFSIPDKLHPRQ